MGNHIITFAPGVPRNEQREFLGFAAKQTHNGEQSEPNNYKLKGRKRADIQVNPVCLLFLFCRGAPEGGGDLRGP